MEFKDTVYARRSNRFLTNQEISKTDLEYILSIAKRAPVTLGRYENIELLVIQGETLKKLQKRFIELNNKDNTFGGMCLIVILHKAVYTLMANQDAGIIGEHICLAAADRNLGSVYLHSGVDMMNTDSYIKNELLNIESNFTVMCAVTLGHKANETVRDVKHDFTIKYYE